MGPIGPRPFHRLMYTGFLPQSNKRQIGAVYRQLRYELAIKPTS